MVTTYVGYVALGLFVAGACSVAALVGVALGECLARVADWFTR